MNNEEYSNDSLAIILLCSNLAINFNVDSVKPFTTVEWSKFAKIVLNSSIKRPANLFNLSKEEIERELLISAKDSERIVQLLSKAGQLSFELNELRNLGIKIATRADKSYPAILKKRLKEKCPPVIYYCGDINILNNRLIGVVGSRNIDSDGLNFTQRIGEKIVSENYSLVSGGAKGVDSVAQDAVLKNNGKVVAFIADSMISKIKKKEIREAITKGNLLLMSAINPKSGFTVYGAMDRNKYIYGLSKLTIVVASDYNKGGTWAGATENLKNSWVPLLVRSEDNVPKGNLELIKLGGNVFNCNSFKSSFEKFLKGEINANEEYYEEDLFSLINSLDNKKEQNVSYDNINIDKVCEKDDVTKTHDVYSLILNDIKEVLNDELSLDEFSKKLNINKK
ncbi:DNA-processing protein DprA [Clostridium algidicarnis]|uniref:DNA-processing protein DprA n=1 Tax=Clostridium algidicarnis TaxID=37659 RepID=UPI001CF3D4DE|nr:DNA-processing protein DprA [Clostridium algidicarnis]MCB2287636.1 DNA-processing protein DprA [Clostridium algidicarnis]